MLLSKKVSFRRAGWVAVAGVLSLTAAACGSSGSGAGSAGGSGGSNKVPSGVGISSFSVNIAATMSKLKPLTEFATKGASSLQVGVILPDTTSSTRWVDFDAPYLADAFTDAGYTSSEFRIDNAQGI